MGGVGGSRRGSSRSKASGESDGNADDGEVFLVDFADLDGGHGIVGGLEADLAVFAVKAFDGDFIFDDSHDDLTIFGVFLLSNKDVIAFEDGVVDHGTTANFEGKDFFLGDIAEQTGIDDQGFFGFFDAGDGCASRDGSEERDAEDVVGREVDLFAVEEGCQSACAEATFAEVALFFEGFEVIIYAVGGANIEMVSDLAESRGIAVFFDGVDDEVVDHLLAFG